MPARNAADAQDPPHTFIHIPSSDAATTRVPGAGLEDWFQFCPCSDLPIGEVACTYRSLWRVERTFREPKSTLRVRPIYQHRDGGSISHIVTSFLALRLEVDLEQRLDERNISIPWPNLMRDLTQVQAVRLNLYGQAYLVRTDLKGHAHAAIITAGVRPPPRLISDNDCQAQCLTASARLYRIDIMELYFSAGRKSGKWGLSDTLIGAFL